MDVILGMVAVVCFAAGVPWFLTHISAKKRLTALRVGFWATWAGASGYTAYLLDQASGWDELGYFMALLLFALPALIGLVGGEVSGRASRNNVAA